MNEVTSVGLSGEEAAIVAVVREFVDRAGEGIPSA
jgi:hypothetical protein